MGRLFQWVRSVTPSRAAGARRAQRERRRLRFERCESRIALSAADGDLTQLEPDELSDQFLLGQADEGGTITISFGAAPWANLGQWANWSALNGQSDIRGAGWGRGPSAAPLSGLWQRAVGSTEGEFAGGWDLSTAGTLVQMGSGTLVDRGGLNIFDSTVDGEYEMPRSNFESASPSANSDLSVIPAPTPTPAETPGAVNQNEGGQIALTPFIAPTGLTLSQGYGSSSVARAKTNLEELHETPAAPSEGAARLEGLRGRAVVYEVADAGSDARPVSSPAAGDATENPTNDAEAIRAVALHEFESQVRPRGNGSMRYDEGVVLASTATQGKPADAGEVATPTLPFNEVGTHVELSFNGGNVQSELLGVDAADLDAAFADWQEARDVDDSRSAGASGNGDRDRRMLGVGVALAASFMPLRKALRRRIDGAGRQELPRRRQHS